MGTTFGALSQSGPPPITLLIFLVALAGVLILLERFFVIVIRSKNNGRVFIERVIQLVRSGKIEDAIKQCAGSKAALADIGLLVLRSRSRDEADLRNIAEAASLMVLPRLTRRIGYLPALALTAVLLGVLGAVRDAHAAFVVASVTPNSAAMWNRLADATTGLTTGLIVAIVLVLGRAYLLSQAVHISEQVQELSARLINALIDRPDVRLGHR